MRDSPLRSHRGPRSTRPQAPRGAQLRGPLFTIRAGSFMLEHVCVPPSPRQQDPLPKSFLVSASRSSASRIRIRVE